MTWHDTKMHIYTILHMNRAVCICIRKGTCLTFCADPFLSSEFKKIKPFTISKNTKQERERVGVSMHFLKMHYARNEKNKQLTHAWIFECESVYKSKYERRRRGFLFKISFKNVWLQLKHTCYLCGNISVCPRCAILSSGHLNWGLRKRSKFLHKSCGPIMALDTYILLNFWQCLYFQVKIRSAILRLYYDSTLYFSQTSLAVCGIYYGKVSKAKFKIGLFMIKN